jgi:hypothetical protein
VNREDIKELVERWLDERVEIDSVANVEPGKGDDDFQAIIASVARLDSEVVTSSYEAFGDFIEWLKEQEEWAFISLPKWASAMEQIGFEQENDGSDRVIRGISLKGD